MGGKHRLKVSHLLVAIVDVIPNSKYHNTKHAFSVFKKSEDSKYDSALFAAGLQSDLHHS